METLSIWTSYIMVRGVNIYFRPTGGELTPRESKQILADAREIFSKHGYRCITVPFSTIPNLKGNDGIEYNNLYCYQEVGASQLAKMLPKEMDPVEDNEIGLIMYVIHNVSNYIEPSNYFQDGIIWNRTDGLRLTNSGTKKK